MRHGGPPVAIVEATRAHAESFVPLMRAADVEEVRALGLSPREAVLDSLEASEVAFAALFGGEVAFLYGVVPLWRTALTGSSTTGQLWFLSGRAVDRHPKAFLRATRASLPRLLERYAVLTNVIDARYAGALRWARWLGATLYPPRPFGPEGVPFCPFVVSAGKE